MSGTPKNELDPIEKWARRTFQVVDVDSVAWTYSGDGPPSWQAPRPEIEGELDPRNPDDWWHQVRLADLRSIATADSRVLDLGCGPGWPAIPLSRHAAEVVCLDASDLAIALVRRAASTTENIRVLRADGLNLPFEENAFDGIVASDLIDVVRDPAHLAREMHRVLKPGGRFISWVQNFRCVLGRDHVCSRSLKVGEGEAVYQYHRALLSPPHSLEMRFHIHVDDVVGFLAELPQEMRDADPDTILQELQMLRPAIRGLVELYRAPEFTPETACEPFGAAGFSDLEVVPLNYDICTSFGRELALRSAEPPAAENFHAMASALLDIMRHTDPDKSWFMSVKGKKPGIGG
jgi:SAM-dependent methyltransferase